jgi:predicted ArsR family transcriptional regulator
MKTTRQQVIEHLHSRRQTSAQEISRVLRMTPANARHHLNTLLNEGVIEVAGQQPASGKGRPTRLYRLTQPAHRHSLDKLASTLLEELAALLPPDDHESCLGRIAARLQGEAASPEGDARGSSARPLPQALFETVRRLNELNYAARWEAHARGPRLILGHCPFAAIIQEHPELCRMDAHLLEGLLGAPVQQLARLVPDGQGERQCVFVFLKKG